MKKQYVKKKDVKVLKGRLDKIFSIESNFEILYEDAVIIGLATLEEQVDSLEELKRDLQLSLKEWRKRTITDGE